MFSTRRRSSTHTAPGRQSSRMLQLEQVTSNFGFIGLKLGLIAMTAGMAIPFGSLLWGGALRDDVAHAAELLALVEELTRPKPARELAVWIGGKIGQHVEIDLGRLAADGA